MDPLCEFLNTCGFHVLRLGLTAHNGIAEEKHLSATSTWLQEVRAAYTEMQTRFPEYARGVLGFSLGGSLAINLLRNDPEFNPKTLVLLAPAVCIQPYFSIARPLLFLQHFRCSLFSLIPKQYCAQRFTPVSMYAAALETFDSVCAIRDLPTQPAAIIFCSPKDGLVHYHALKNWIALNKLNNWKFVDLKIEGAALRHFNHLLINPLTMGEPAWQAMTEVMRQHLESVFAI